MAWQDIALAAAGVIGGVVAVVHGLLVQRLMVTPIAATADLNGASRRLVPILLHLSTVAWFAGGLALIGAAFWFDDGARLATSVGVGALYAYGAVGNAWGTRGRHLGWLLYAIAVALIVFALGR